MEESLIWDQLDSRTGTYLVIRCVDQNLIKDLEEPRNKGGVAIVSQEGRGDVPVHHHLGRIIIHPHHLGNGLNRTNVGIRPLQHVLELGELDVNWGLVVCSLFGTSR